MMNLNIYVRSEMESCEVLIADAQKAKVLGLRRTLSGGQHIELVDSTCGLQWIINALRSTEHWRYIHTVIWHIPEHNIQLQ